MTLNESNGANKNEQQEQQNPPPPRASKRARRAPKAVYDNDFEAHEIQNVRKRELFRRFVNVSFLSLTLSPDDELDD